MKIFRYILVLFLLWTADAEAAIVNNARIGNYPDKTRIVLDLDEVTLYTEKLEGNELKITLNAALGKTQELKAPPDFAGKITLQSKDKKTAVLTVSFAEQPATYKVFVLKTPERLVVDLYRFVRSKETVAVAKGITYTSWRDVLNARPVWLHVLEVAPAADYELKPVAGQVSNIEKGVLSQLAAKTGALAMINASYFDSSKWVIGNLKIGDVWVGGDDLARTALVMGKGAPAAVYPGLTHTAAIKAGQVETGITGINRERLANDLILYNGFYGARTGTNNYGMEVRVKKGVVTEVSSNGNMLLTTDSEVLSGHGAGAKLLGALKPGMKLAIIHRLSNEAAAKAEYVVGGGPQLLKDGRIAVTAAEENFANDIKNGRAPRTAIGIKQDGTLLLVVVDGRSVNSSGVTLADLAAYLQKLGAWSALNMDGGGSSAMIIKNKVVNSPSDGRERPVRAALGLYAK